MAAKIKWNDSDAYETAITQWIVRHLKEKGVRETHFSREAGLGRSETDARTFRKLKEGKRHWTVVDLCKVAAYFGASPSGILSKVERFYRSEGIVQPDRIAEQMLNLGVERSTGVSPLISTWQKKGRSFVLVDCDEAWKKAAKGELNRVIGLTSKEVFAPYPKVQRLFDRVWKHRQREATEIWYQIKTSLEKKVFLTDSERRLFSINLTYVPPNLIVVYAEDITRKNDDRPNVREQSDLKAN
jgi:hypothetical protein